MANKQGLLYLTPKASFYNSQKEVVDNAKEMHLSALKEDRTLYTYLLYFNNATYYSKSLIINNLLSHSLNKPENSSILEEDAGLLDVEDALIVNALFNENITHALKLLTTLKKNRVNNARTTKVILNFLFKRGNLDHISVKYKSKVKELIIHAVGLGVAHSIAKGEPKGIKAFNKQIAPLGNPFSQEVVEFLFDTEQTYKSPYLAEYVQVRQAFKNRTLDGIKGTKLPIEVLEGFNSSFGCNFDLKYLLEKAVVSEKQKIQIQNRVAKVNKTVKEPSEKIEVKVDYTKHSLFDLYRLLYSKKGMTKVEVFELTSIISEKQAAMGSIVRENFMTDLSQTAILFDASGSTEGSEQSHLHPFIKSYILSGVLADKMENIYYVGGKMEEGLFYPEGHTDLASGLLRVAKDGFKNLIVLSDGFQNVGDFGKVHNQLKKIGFDINVTHFNPVFSPKNFSFKTISDDVSTIPYSSEKELVDLGLYYLLAENQERFKEVVRAKIETELLKGGQQ